MVSLKVEKVNGRKRGGGGNGLQRHHQQGLLWTARQPLNRKKYQYRQLCGHEQLPEMGRSPFIGFKAPPKMAT
jgi:hypothetical protein